MIAPAREAPRPRKSAKLRNTAAAPGTDEHREQLRDRCMRELSSTDRLIIVLYYYEKLTLREVAAVMNVPEEQVEVRRQTLARRLSVLAKA